MPCCPPIVCVDAKVDGFNDGAAADAGLRYGAASVLRVTSIADLVNQLETHRRTNGCCICRLMIVGHGSPGEISVGDGQESEPNRRLRVDDTVFASLVTGLKRVFCTADEAAACDGCVPELVLWGCNVGSGPEGATLLQALADGIGVPVGAETGVVYGTLWPQRQSRRVRATPGQPAPPPTAAPNTNQPPLREWPPGDPFSPPADTDRDPGLPGSRSRYRWPPPQRPDPLPAGPCPPPDHPWEPPVPVRPLPPPPRRPPPPIRRRFGLQRVHPGLKALRSTRPHALLIWPAGHPLPATLDEVDRRLVVEGVELARALLAGIDGRHGWDIRDAGFGWEGWILPVRDGRVLTDRGLVVTGACQLAGSPDRLDTFLRVDPWTGLLLRQTLRLGRLLLAGLGAERAYAG